MRLRHRPGHRWDPRFSHFRRIENSLDHLYVRRVFPVLTTRSLSDRFRNIEASRSHFSLGYVSWLTFGVFWYISSYLFIFYATTSVFSTQHGLPIDQSPYAWTSDIVESHRNGYQLIGEDGTVLLDPDFDELLLVRIGSERTIAAETLAEVVTRDCSRKETHGIPRRIRIMIHPDPGASYQDVVTVLEEAARIVQLNPDCDVGYGLVTNRKQTQDGA